MLSWDCETVIGCEVRMARIHKFLWIVHYIYDTRVTTESLTYKGYVDNVGNIFVFLVHATDWMMSWLSLSCLLYTWTHQYCTATQLYLATWQLYCVNLTACDVCSSYVEVHRHHRLIWWMYNLIILLFMDLRRLELIKGGEMNKSASHRAVMI